MQMKPASSFDIQVIKKTEEPEIKLVDIEVKQILLEKTSASNY